MHGNNKKTNDVKMPGDGLTHQIENILIRLFLELFETNKTHSLHNMATYKELKFYVGSGREQKFSMSDFKKAAKIAVLAINNRAKMIGYDLKESENEFKKLTELLIEEFYKHPGMSFKLNNS